MTVADLCLDARRPFALVTSIRRSGPRASNVHPQLELNLPGHNLRLRFATPDSLVVFSDAVNALFDDMIRYSHGDAGISVRVHQPGLVQLELPC